MIIQIVLCVVLWIRSGHCLRGKNLFICFVEISFLHSNQTLSWITKQLFITEKPTELSSTTKMIFYLLPNSHSVTRHTHKITHMHSWWIPHKFVAHTVNSDKTFPPLSFVGVQKLLVCDGHAVWFSMALIWIVFHHTFQWLHHSMLLLCFSILWHRFYALDIRQALTKQKFQNVNYAGDNSTNWSTHSQW